MATKTKGKILVVDDNAGIRGALKVLLPLHFEQVELIASPKELMAKMNQFRQNVVLLDMNFHTDINTGNEGLYWVAELKKYFPQTEVVLFTAYADIQLAVEGMKRGAFDFVVKPWDNAKLVEILAKAVEKNRKEQKQSPQQVQQQVLPLRLVPALVLLLALQQQVLQLELLAPESPAPVQRFPAQEWVHLLRDLQHFPFDVPLLQLVVFQPLQL